MKYSAHRVHIIAQDGCQKAFMKIFGFRHQFYLSSREIDSLRRICLFVCTIYATFWFAAPMALAAPINDLRMLQLVEQFSSVDSKAGLFDLNH